MRYESSRMVHIPIPSPGERVDFCEAKRRVWNGVKFDAAEVLKLYLVYNYCPYSTSASLTLSTFSSGEG